MFFRQSGKTGDGGEQSFILSPVVKGEDVRHFPFFKTDREDRVVSVALFVLNLHLVKTRRQRLDRFHGGDDFGMLFLGDFRRNEDPQMADILMDHVDDLPAAHLDFMLVAISVGDPVQRLLRRRDVVAGGGEDDHGRTNIAQIKMGARVEIGLTAGEFVADK